MKRHSRATYHVGLVASPCQTADGNSADETDGRDTSEAQANPAQQRESESESIG